MKPLTSIVYILLFNHWYLKDAKGVSWNPYNRSQILQYFKYTKWINIAKGI